MSSDKLPVAVIGGGISGMTTAVEAAETGLRAVIIEREHWLGGRVFGMHRYFPKLCSPLCGMEINFQRVRRNPDITVITGAELVSLSGSDGDFTLKATKNPRFINANCTACDKCAQACPVERNDDFNLGMSKTKAAYIRHPMAFPAVYAIDPSVCEGEKCAKCVPACGYGAIELAQKPETLEIRASSVVYATGWKPYDAAKIGNLGFGRVSNVITNVMMERIASPSGPTGGRIVRPSDGKEVKNIAFAQCAGSRDENHLAHCSAVCCLASLKQVAYLREAYKDSKATVFYIDIRTPGKYEGFYAKIAADPGVSFIKGKVAGVEEDPATRDVIITAEDVAGGAKKSYVADMLVLATGMEPNSAGLGAGVSGWLDSGGFFAPEKTPAGIYSAGVAKNPADVSASLMDATATAVKCLGGRWT
ncbi:MAG: CoB--CoM heterodisulfide reductase iron-sulfur subunit A family protein [Nitrospinae bacterium]|nr:CoB--CoM heterodisulfide reductase iron-sulfur subunit A family protein [Nitrospinota bacterium]